MDIRGDPCDHCGAYILSAALATEGFGWLALAVLLAGLVRGFTGFGSALVYLPIGAMFLPPTWVIASMIGFSIIGPIPLIPRALAEVNKGEVLRIGMAAWLGVPLGVFLLTRLEPEGFRWLVSSVALITLLLLASGWRYKGEVPIALGMGAGFAGGFLGGFVGLGGPPVILLYLGSQRAVAGIRAIILLYLVMMDFAVVTVFYVGDLIPLQAFLIGVLLGPFYLMGGIIGQWFFDPKHEALFRALAYGIILLALLTGLPVFD